MTHSPEMLISGHPLAIQLNSFLTQHLKPKARLLLALSGGLDSCVLLHLLAQARHILSFKTLSFDLRAMHIHHGLSPNADLWTDYSAKLCEKLGVPFKVAHVNIDKNTSLGIEAEARILRYQALFSYKWNEAHADYVVTAHHQDDQAETLLLQLFRGAGIKGLSAMAAVDDSKRLLRPLLNTPRQELLSYAQAHGITWCEDESNDNTHYERNFVRHELMPILEARYPTVKTAIARTAFHVAEANDLLNDLAKMDTEPLLQKNSLCLHGLRNLDNKRAKNSLRWWFSQNQLLMPSAEQLNQVVSQLLDAKPDANLSIQLQGSIPLQSQSPDGQVSDGQPSEIIRQQYFLLRRFQNRAYLSLQAANILPEATYDLVWNGESELILPNGSRLEFKQVIGAGLALKLGINKLRITNRQGGERFKPDTARPTRTLKYLMQEAHIPPWQREKMPLIYWQDALACVPGIGIAHELQANESELGWQILWIESI